MSDEVLDISFESPKTEAVGTVKNWIFRAIHPTVSGNRRQYTEEELTLSARGLSFRPLNINHDKSFLLPYRNESTGNYINSTLLADWDNEQKAVVGVMRIEDPRVNQMIESGLIKKVSIEQIPYKGEDCNINSQCIQKGVIQVGLALLTNDIPAGDSTSFIKKFESVEEIKSEIIPEIISEVSSVKNVCQCSIKDMESTTNTEIKTEGQSTTSTEPKIPEVKNEMSVISASDFQKFLAQNEKQHNESLSAITDKIGLLIPQPKEEKCSSEVIDIPKTYFESAIEPASNWFNDIRMEKATTDYFTWIVPKEEMLKGLGLKSPNPEDSVKKEAVTITDGDKPISVDNKVVILPSGQMITSIRPYCDVKVLNNVRTFQWWRGTGFDVDGTTAEGTEETNESQTISKVTVTPAIYRSVQTIDIGDIEEMNVDLIDYFNRSAMAGAINVENNAILNTLLDAQTPSNVPNDSLGWINANSGATIATTDDVASMTFDPKAFTSALAILSRRGFDVSRGNVMAFLHPVAIQQLADAVDGDYATKDFSVTATELAQYIDRRYGVEIVSASKVTAKDNTTNDTYRNYIMVKGAVGLGIGSNLTIEAQKKVELSAIKVGARHKVAGAVLLAGGIIRVSSAQ